MNRHTFLNCVFSGKQTGQPHFHAEYELFYVLRGNPVLTANEIRYQLAKDDFFLINTGWMHGWSGEGNILTGSILIDIEHLSALFGNTPVLFSCCSTTLRPEDADEIRKLVYQLFTYSHADEGLGRLMFNGLSCQFLYLMTSRYLAKKNDPMWNLPHDGPVKRTYDILRYMNESYAQTITLGSLAEQLNLSVPYLSKLFKEQFGSTFLSYLQALRLKHATEEILHTEKTLTRIALDNGFPNSASFIRTFRQANGISPGEFRKNSRSADADSPQQPEEMSGSAADADISEIVRTYLTGHGIHPALTTFANQEQIRVSRHPGSVQANRSFRKPWTKLLNVGNASNLLRYDVREQVSQLHDELHFEYLYISNILDPDMHIASGSAAGKPNFSEIRKVLDFVVSLGMHPYIELESQERDIPRSIDSRMIEARIRSRLADLSTNYELFDSLVSFVIRRYGREEVSKWIVSVEQSTAIGNQVPEKEYFQYFSSVYRMLKSRIPDISVGGPGFTIDFSEDRLESFLRNWLASGPAPDFISVYVFPYIMNLDSLREGRNVSSADRNYLANALTSLNHVLPRLNLSDREIHATLWNSTMSNRNALNDSCFKSAYIMNSLLGSWDKCHLIGYWYASDIPASDSALPQPLFGGCGLLTQNGLKKPAFHAFGFLNQLYPYYLTGTEHAVVTANDRGRFAICCHNYKHFNHLYYQQPESRIVIEEQQLYYEDYEDLVLRFTISDLPEGTFLIKKRYVSEQAGNIQNAWLMLSRQEELSSYEMNYLNARSEPGLAYAKVSSRNGCIRLEETLKPQEICLIMIELIYD